MKTKTANIYPEFRALCSMPQKGLKKHLTKQLSQKYPNVTVADGYVFAQGEFPVLLVAHLDTVHSQLPTSYVYDRNKDALSSPNGIGGDDRCGVYMILEIIKQYNCSVLFCEDEEVGGVGAGKFIKSQIAKKLEFNYIIEFDRMGSNDAVFYDCDNPDFEKFITKDFYKTAFGTFSDISVIAPALGCAAVNLSCGYHSPHTKNEYVIMTEMKSSIHAACEILKRTTAEDKFEYIEAVGYGYDNYRGYFTNDWSEEKFYLIEYLDEKGDFQYEEVIACSKAEAVGKFCMAYPHIPYADIEYITDDYKYGYEDYDGFGY